MTRPLRYLLVGTHVPASGAGGGMVRYVMELARGLAARDDVELHVLAGAGAQAAFTGIAEPDRVHTLPGHGPAGSAIERLAGGRVGGRMDVVHGTKHLLPRGVPGVGVLTVHDMLALDRPFDFGLAKRLLVRGPYLASLRAADALVCVSAATRDRVTAYLPSVAPRAVVVPHPDGSSLTAVAAEEVPELAGRTFALVVGDPSPRKNVGLVVDAWAQVRRHAPDAVLVVVGPDSWGPSDRGDAFAALVAAGAVAPMGHVSDARLRWLYEHARLVLCPSLAEGFGLPAAEALAFGAPVLTSEDPALAEASAGRAERLPGRRPEVWAEAVLAHLRTPAPPRTPVPARRGWADVVDETLEAVRRAGAR
ncbi:glycosyltransferase family 4 protein [Modestobacter roseus]|uniref:Glycosyltransferase involved in cell wall biosynthesis n=1 Tax=Modestobacter roseus TaxID=1181884 RepID=A0A562IWK0_9ACTN|nr:glycosyltransferase family 1 protein [Modestobacter roseus]TWH75358.1 glycosyltransferase involved in cell wall biosynthesis [Modestobacter roseus]